MYNFNLNQPHQQKQKIKKKIKINNNVTAKTRQRRSVVCVCVCVLHRGLFTSWTHNCQQVSSRLEQGSLVDLCVLLGSLYTHPSIPFAQGDQLSLLVSRKILAWAELEPPPARPWSQAVQSFTIELPERRSRVCVCLESHHINHQSYTAQCPQSQLYERHWIDIKC